MFGKPVVATAKNNAIGQCSVVDPVRWSLVKVEERSGGVLVCTLGHVMQSVDLTFPSGGSQSAVRESHVRAWKECAEQTLYRLSLYWPDYSPPLDRISGLLGIFKAGRPDRSVRFVGQVLQPKRLIKFGAVGHLIAIKDRQGIRLALCNFDADGHHIEMRSAVHELESVQFLRWES